MTHFGKTFFFPEKFQRPTQSRQKTPCFRLPPTSQCFIDHVSKADFYTLVGKSAVGH